ncbi:hypothetical protein GCM10007866_00340 [Gluconobacter albidus]|uniref:Transposase n=1 Tax=Gluconobacter albidus TaxID=318683 RepID=A0ABQ5WVK6_9PROT|nr:hypothetical protein GCM10007866_00340 [Gluconobacter albidus]
MFGQPKALEAQTFFMLRKIRTPMKRLGRRTAFGDEREIEN